MFFKMDVGFICRLFCLPEINQGAVVSLRFSFVLAYFHYQVLSKPLRQNKTKKQTIKAGPLCLLMPSL